MKRALHDEVCENCGPAVNYYKQKSLILSQQVHSLEKKCDLLELQSSEWKQKYESLAQQNFRY